MIINGTELLNAAPINSMFTAKERTHGVSHGLAEAGYDIRIKQDVTFYTNVVQQIARVEVGSKISAGRFTIASAMEVFHMPEDMVGVVHDKSTWARRGLSVFNTVIEPGFRGGLTLELVFHGEGSLHIPAGAGIAQVLFSRVYTKAAYSGKYQNQSTEPVPAILEI